ncbi:MAG: class I SAM-dependent methyltransferase [Burkholderiaceae bacterium]
MTLPPPGPDALAHSATPARRIARAIDAGGGWMPFDRWMAQALYEPGLGYYAGPARPFGAGGDFVTAPELSPLFAECVAVQVSAWFAHTEPVVIEFGAGTGRLAAGVLETLHALGTPARRYAIVEVSGALRARQRETLARLVPHALDAVEWLDALPESIDGVVLANEVLDAMPVRLFELAGGGRHEIGVEIDVGSDPAAPGFRWAARPADAELQEAIARALRAALPPDAPANADPFEPLGPGPYRSELGLQAQAWMGTVGGALRQGAMLLIDYGFPAREYYHPQRDGGTLVAHRRHRVHAEVLRWPGLQDVTAHVDFSALARAAGEAGLDTIGYLSQARFLLNCGLLDRLAEATRDAPDGPRDAQAVRALGAVQTLLSEAEMGELFKVVAFGRGMPTEALGFLRGDRSGAL